LLYWYKKYLEGAEVEALVIVVVVNSGPNPVHIAPTFGKASK
jgi:hypothetical protein